MIRADIERKVIKNYMIKNIIIIIILEISN
jgi:hypothetical protein